jgi:hypothetical protein
MYDNPYLNYLYHMMIRSIKSFLFQLMFLLIQANLFNKKQSFLSCKYNSVVVAISYSFPNILTDIINYN